MIPSTMLLITLGLGPVELSPRPPLATVALAPSSAIELLERAQQETAAGNVEDALQSLERAIEADDSMAAAYLTRAQVLVELLGDLDDVPPNGPAWDAQAIARARLAASDLARYLELVGIDGDAAAPLEAQRAQLLRLADQAVARAREAVDAEAQGPPGSEPTDPGPARHPPRRPGRPWYADALGGGLTFGGLALVGGGVATLAIGQRRHAAADGLGSEQRFVDDSRLGRTLHGVGIGLAALGGSLVVGGIIRYVVVARRRADSPSATRRHHRGRGLVWR